MTCDLCLHHSDITTYGVCNACLEEIANHVLTGDAQENE